MEVALIMCGWWGHDGGGECSRGQILESKLLLHLGRVTLAHRAVSHKAA